MSRQKSIQETCAELKTDLQKGLTDAEAARRLSQYGKNGLPEAKRKTLFTRFLEQLHDPLIYVLLAALLVVLIILGIKLIDTREGTSYELL